MSVVAADPPPPVPGPVLPAGPATMLELGAALGADVWWLEQIFAVAGGWVARTPEAAVRVHLAELSRVAGDHAQALRSLLPRPAPVDPAAWIAPPWPAAGEVLAAGDDTSGARLAVVHRVVVARLLAVWARPLGPSAAGVARALRHARTDLAELRDEGEGLLHALMAGDERHGAGVHGAAAAAEVTLVAGGGLRPRPPVAPPAPGD